MKSNKLRISILLCLFFIEILSLFLTYKTFSNKEIKEIKELNKIAKKHFSMYVENEEGKYKEYTSSNIFPVGYKINLTKSNCVDTKGNKIDGILSGTSNSVTVSSNKTAYCYIYFDIDYVLSKLCKKGDNLGSCLTTNNEEIDSLDDTAYAEMYRYTGTNEIVDDNYICFGTTDKDTCVNNPDTYMYQIVGITSEDNATLGLETNQLKLIKHTSIGDHEWHSDYTTDTKWEYSTMYTYLQNDVLNNTTYYPSGWSNKIDSVKWNIGNTQTYTNGNAVYESECSFVTSNQSKLGLIYLSDYYYAYKTGGNENCVSVTCKNWLTDISNPIWTMNRYGYHPAYNDYRAWRIHYSGIVDNPNFVNIYSIRPVFYLNSEEIYVSGNGTIDDPIMLDETKIPFGEYILSNPTSGLDATTPYSGMYRYIGTTANNYVKLSDGTNEVLYRIIGIVSEGNETLGLETNQVKIIKATRIGNYNWHTSETTNTKWESSAIYTYLQGSSVLGRTSIVPSGWSDKISSVKWNIGNVKKDTNGDTVYGLEDDSTTSNTSKVGLMYLSDYYYAYNAGGTQNCTSTASCTNWMTNTSNSTWTMTRYSYDSSTGDYRAWAVLTIGRVGTFNLVSSVAVHPVFYLTNDIYITNPEASGTSGDPFIIE